MASGQTCITYGDLKILNCLTREFRQEAVYDESETDLLYYRFTIRVVGWLTGRAITSASSTHVFPTVSSTSAGSHEALIRHHLAPRKRFEMRMGANFGTNGQVVGGVVVLSADPFQSDTDWQQPTEKDLNNGPKAKLIDVTQISSDNLMRAEFEFEICKVECDGTGSCPNTSGVLSNRWSVVDEIDRNFYTTRTFTGVLRTVSSTINANTFRHYVVPPLQPGMRRESMQFQVTPDGLKLAYTIVDREVAFAPPAPATTWRMIHSERVEREGQLGFYSELDIMLGGDRTVDKKLLISIAASIAEAKLLTKANPNGSFLQSINISDEYSDDASVIHLRAVARRTEANVGAIFGVAVARIGKPLEAADLAPHVANYDRNLSRGARQGESLEVEGPIKLIGAFAAYLQSPCSDQHKIFDAQDGSESETPSSRSLYSLSGEVVSEIPDDGSLSSYSDATSEAMYTLHQMESTYRTEGVTAHLPVLGATSLGGGEISGPTSAFVTLAPALCRRVIRIASERVGAWPKALNPPKSFGDSNGITHRLLRKSIRPGTPERTADNKRIYRVAAELVYGLDREPPEGAKLVSGANPWERSAGIYEMLTPALTEAELAG